MSAPEPGPLYGPPPHPEQVVVATGLFDMPVAWLACVGLGVLLCIVGGLMFRRRALAGAILLISGHVLALTAPMGCLLHRHVLGAWPSLDKAGSYLFFMDGVHRRLLDPAALTTDPAMKLIGVHLGHLWVTDAFALVLSPHGAFNLQGFLYPGLGWLAAWLLVREAGAERWPALLASFPFGMGLHVFRDLHWATVEKAAVFGIPLFLWALWRAHRRGGPWLPISGLIFAATAFLNWYLALVNGALLLMALVGARDRRTTGAALLAALFTAPLVVVQAALLPDAGPLSDPERFLWERAALDVISLWPPRWYHMEAWRALNLPLMALGLAGLWRYRQARVARYGGLAALTLALLALGPMLVGAREQGLPNPVYHLARFAVPGFWRVAKPEFFFQGTLIILLVAAGRILGDLTRGRPRLLAALHLALLAGWLISVRAHPAWPVVTRAVPVELDPGWTRRVFGAPEDTGEDAGPGPVPLDGDRAP